MNDSPVAPHLSLRKCSPNSDGSVAEVGLQFRVSSFGPFLYFGFRKDGGCVEGFATGTNDMLGRGGQDVLSKARISFRRLLGERKVQEPPFVHVGMKVPQENGFAVKATLEEFAPNSEPLLTFPEF